MDLLGSILGSMKGPPSVSEEEKARRKKQRDLARQMEEKQRAAGARFREKAEAKIQHFLKNDKDPGQDEEARRKLVFAPMEKYERSIVHDVAEIAGLVAHSFGEDGVDRHIVIWKKECSPCEDELACHRQGVKWDREKNAQEKALAAEQKAGEEREEQQNGQAKKKKEKFVPKGENYQSKYEHLIGTESALEGARKTEMKKSYGMVSAESKKDKRTVEDIQAEIRAKKKRKLEEESTSEASSSAAAAAAAASASTSS